MGNLNLPYINWTTRQSQALCSKLIDLINTNSLRQDVNDPTRRNNIFDFSDLRMIGLEVTDKIDGHQMIDFKIEVLDPNARTHQKPILYYKRTNFELMNEELGSINYEALMRNKTAEECMKQKS
ncbi:hypothetical protein FHG87_010874 [Trinorchestia longiramus]|nr:hypothetical protein FHG87_010874 [Trinorchestia longiramus]